MEIRLILLASLNEYWVVPHTFCNRTPGRGKGPHNATGSLQCACATLAPKEIRFHISGCLFHSLAVHNTPATYRTGGIWILMKAFSWRVLSIIANNLTGSREEGKDGMATRNGFPKGINSFFGYRFAWSFNLCFLSLFAFKLTILF